VSTKSTSPKLFKIECNKIGIAEPWMNSERIHQISPESGLKRLNYWSPIIIIMDLYSAFKSADTEVLDAAQD